MIFAKITGLIACTMLLVRSLSWVLVFGFYLFSYATNAKSEDGGVTFNASQDYTSGSYGAKEKTSILYAPLSMEFYKGPWSMRTVVPWLSVKGPALVVDGGLSEGNTDEIVKQTSGLGDVSVSLMYSFENLYKDNLFVDFTTRLKLPTASYDQGLGSGEFDTSLQLDTAKVLGDLMPFSMIGYKFSNSPIDIEFQNTIFGSIGMQYRWSNLTSVGVVYDYQQSSVKNTADSQELLMYTNFRVVKDWSFNLYLLSGLSANSPDYGGGLSFSYKVQY